MKMAAAQGISGSSLPPAYLLNIQTACTQIYVNESLDALPTYWGQILGVAADYFILVSRSISGGTVHRRFWFSLNGGLEVAVLPVIGRNSEAKVLRIASKLYSRFEGAPAKLYSDAPSQPTSDDASVADGDDEAVTKSETITELERLAYTITQIDDSTSLCVAGSLAIDASGRIAAVPGFAGLSVKDLKKFSNYQLLRNAQLDVTARKLRAGGHSTHINAFDSLADVVIAERGKNAPEDQSNVNEDELEQSCTTWRIMQQPSGLAVTLRNWQWPGYEFRVHAAIAGDTGGAVRGVGAYVGTGLKFEELHFCV